ncbi:hypothetical protein NL676_002305 [Syzygium grande]|nr:hypothetical protein NL676_002305 [Syzygium grande]
MGLRRQQQMRRSSGSSIRDGGALGGGDVPNANMSSEQRGALPLVCKSKVRATSGAFGRGGGSGETERECVLAVLP